MLTAGCVLTGILSSIYSVNRITPQLYKMHILHIHAYFAYFEFSGIYLMFLGSIPSTYHLQK